MQNNNEYNNLANFLTSSSRFKIRSIVGIKDLKSGRKVFNFTVTEISKNKDGTYNMMPFIGVSVFESFKNNFFNEIQQIEVGSFITNISFSLKYRIGKDKENNIKIYHEMNLFKAEIGKNYFNNIQETNSESNNDEEVPF